MNTGGPFSGRTGLKLRIAGLVCFPVLFIILLARGDYPYAFGIGVYWVIGLFETYRYYRRL